MGSPRCTLVADGSAGASRGCVAGAARLIVDQLDAYPQLHPQVVLEQGLDAHVPLSEVAWLAVAGGLVAKSPDLQRVATGLLLCRSKMAASMPTRSRMPRLALRQGLREGIAVAAAASRCRPSVAADAVAAFDVTEGLGAALGGTARHACSARGGVGACSAGRARCQAARGTRDARAVRESGFALVKARAYGAALLALTPHAAAQA